MQILPAWLDRGNLSCRVEHPGFAGQAEDRYLPIKDLRAMKSVVVLDRGFTLNGTVADERGKPIEGALVTLCSEGDRLSDPTHRMIVAGGAGRAPGDRARRCVNTDADGRFHFEHRSPGIELVTVLMPGFAPGLKQVRFGPPNPEDEPAIADEPPADGDAGPGAQADDWPPRADAIQLTKEGPSTPPLLFRLGPGRTIHARVIETTGKPVVRATVIPEIRGNFDGLGWRGTTDVDGRFQWTNSPLEPMELHVYASPGEAPGPPKKSVRTTRTWK